MGFYQNCNSFLAGKINVCEVITEPPDNSAEHREAKRSSQCSKGATNGGRLCRHQGGEARVRHAGQEARAEVEGLGKAPHERRRGRTGSGLQERRVYKKLRWVAPRESGSGMPGPCSLHVGLMPQDVEQVH